MLPPHGAWVTEAIELPFTFIVDASRLCDHFSVRVCVFNDHFFLAHAAAALVADTDVSGGTLSIGGTRLALLACNNINITIVLAVQFYTQFK